MFHSTKLVGEAEPEEHYDSAKWDSFSTAMGELNLKFYLTTISIKSYV